MLSYFKFHHIGIAVYSIDETAEYYLRAGYKRTNAVEDVLQNIKICFLFKQDMPLVELLEPVNDSSPVCSILKQNGVSPYHVCYSVLDIEMAISDLKRQGYLPLSRPVKAIAMNNNKISFLYNKSIGLIELVEEVNT